MVSGRFFYIGKKTMKKSLWLKPFVLSGVFWWAVGICFLFMFGPFHWLGFFTFTNLVILGVLNLYSLGLVISSLLSIAAGQGELVALMPKATLILNGGVKICLLALYIFILIKAASLSTEITLLGMGTVFFVPVIGGLMWFKGRSRLE